MSDNKVQHPFSPTAEDDRTVVLGKPGVGPTGNRPPFTPHLAADTAVRLGSEIKNRFTLVALLGEGGMGKVYRARDRRREEAQDKNPYVALKVLGEDFKRHPQAFVALQREAQKTQTLAHPNIITIYDFDRDGDVVYLTMEELRGRPLYDIIYAADGITLPMAQRVQIIISIARGLAYAHDKNIVHSDLKPGNVFLTEDDEIKVLDFGIARACSAGSGNAADGDKTVFDARDLGALTPAYASLEMLQGAAPHTADDIYALGVIAYELLTGEHPFQKQPADRARAKNLQPRRIKGLSKRRWQALKQALAFAREGRIQNARAFLERFAPRRKKSVVTSAAVVVAALIAAGTFLAREDPNAPEIAFTDLPAEVQQTIERELESAATALTFNDYNSALLHYNRIYLWHKNNRRAMQGLNELLSKLTPRLEGANTRAEKDAALKEVTTLLGYESLQNNEKLLNIQKELIAH